MESNKNQFGNQNQNLKQNIQQGEQAGSTLDLEEKEFRKFDDWHAHKYEHNRDLNAEYRAGELHGVVGKEIHDALKTEQCQDKFMYNQPGHQQYQGGQQGQQFQSQQGQGLGQQQFQNQQGQQGQGLGQQSQQGQQGQNLSSQQQQFNKNIK
jgi:hypothetical protein